MKNKHFYLISGLFLLVVFLILPVFFFTPGFTGNAITGDAIGNGDLTGLELSVIVPEKYQKVGAGETLQFQVAVKNIQKAGRHDIQLDYYIKKNGILITHRRELKAVETQASFISSIQVPEETLPGIYNIEVEINEEESSLATFYVKSSELGQVRLYLLLLIVAIVVIGGLITWELHRLFKIEKRALARRA